ncbi:hypothetical protein ERJ75_001412900 [Trypanosoma vivax]|nr:hypothetical protein ERJ75_001412900 [Trypanosoma vivax]
MLNGYIQGWKAHRDMLDAVSQGLAMLEEMGAMNAPIQCEALLHLEAAQAHYNLEEFESALQCAQRAKGVLMEARAELRDAARVAETNTLIGYILLKSGKIDEANDVFTEVLQWIDVDAKTTTPMQAVSAVNLRRSVVSGLGFCYHRLAEREQTSGGSAKELFGKALDLLIEALNAHIDENDHDSVKLTLLSVLQCFDGVGDGGQATTTRRNLSVGVGAITTRKVRL